MISRHVMNHNSFLIFPACNVISSPIPIAFSVIQKSTDFHYLLSFSGTLKFTDEPLLPLPHYPRISFPIYWTYNIKEILTLAHFHCAYASTPISFPEWSHCRRHTKCQNKEAAAHWSPLESNLCFVRVAFLFTTYPSTDVHPKNMTLTS